MGRLSTRRVHLLATGLLAMGLLATGCDAPPTGASAASSGPPTASVSMTARAPTASAPPAPVPPRMAMSEVRPRPERLHFKLDGMGKGEEARFYDIELDVAAWAISGKMRWGRQSYALASPKPLSSAQRATLEPTLDAMTLVTDDAKTCQARKDDPAIYCGDFPNVDISGESYDTAPHSCRHVEFVDGADPHQAVARTFREVAPKTRD
jgi:hypothetical protein